MTISLTIKELKQLIMKNGFTTEILEMLQADNRKGAENLLLQHQKQVKKEQDQKEAYEQKLSYEKNLYKQGYTLIAGMDEAGRGPLAGPVVAAAVVLPKDFYLPGLNDSKQINAKDRVSYFNSIKQEALYYGIGIIHNQEIDEMNIFEATKKAMHQAVSQIETELEHVLIDAVELNGLSCPYTSIIKGDQKSVSIAAASILAKVTRDRWMYKASTEYPVYGFDKNMGYGTKGHLNALQLHGPSPYHRYSFAPVRQSNI